MVEGKPNDSEDMVDGKIAMPSTEYIKIYDRLMKAANIGRPSLLASILGIKNQSVSTAMKRKVIPPGWLMIISEKYNVSLDWLRYGTGSMHRGVREEFRPLPGTPTACLSPEDFDVIPLLESRVTAGPGGEILYEDIADYYPFKRWWIERLVGKNPERKKNLLLIRVRGDSMSPTINQGELILVDTYEGERIEIRTGRIYLVIQPDATVTVKRLAFSEQHGRARLICISDNVAAYAPFDFELDPERQLKYYVLGRVRWAGKEFD